MGFVAASIVAWIRYGPLSDGSAETLSDVTLIATVVVTGGAALLIIARTIRRLVRWGIAIHDYLQTIVENDRMFNEHVEMLDQRVSDIERWLAYEVADRRRRHDRMYQSTMRRRAADREATPSDDSAPVDG